LRAFQSKAAFRAFSTPRAPPETQKWWGKPGGVTREPRLLRSGHLGGVDVRVGHVGAGGAQQLGLEGRVGELGWLYPMGQEAKKEDTSRYRRPVRAS